MRRVLVLLFSVVFFSCNAYGVEQFSVKQHMEQLKAVAIEKGAYSQYDRWPKDYFLIPQNLPFVVGLSLYLPGNETLNLSTDQKTAIHAIRNQTVPAVLKLAVPIKEKELELAEKLLVQRIEPQKLYALLDEIAAMRLELTKAHMTCIQSVQDVLDAGQYDALLKLAEKSGNDKKKQGEGK